MTEKSKITAKFSELRKWGFLVAHFTDNRRGTKGNNGFPDIHILGWKRLIYAEVKIGKDTLSPDQVKYAFALTEVPGVIYCILTEKNYNDIFALIVAKDWYGLESYLKGEDNE